MNRQCLLCRPIITSKHIVASKRSSLLRRVSRTNQRSFVSQSRPEISSHQVRQQFLDYFVKKHGHTFIRSSPVVPFCDPSVAFVNAGMNQFKNVFLGQTPAPCRKAANSQKCIRVGGKHNDLDAVGTDSYHHTFFEMLGNWSFGDYFKKEACEMAWNLLTGPYRIPPSRLYVTYFGGDIPMKLEPDMETREIWRKIGLPLERILPFGLSENFWEMGPAGPCGPCTEIHVDHMPGRGLAADRVNKGHADLTELWNLVFIQFNRLSDGSLVPLPTRHVDTGMGFERLVALLQDKQSNYDTDMFTPIFLAIEAMARVRPYGGLFGSEDTTGLDTAYRILADHARMITVALSDGMFPDHNYKLRRIIRRALVVSKKSFNVEHGMLGELTNYVADTLADVYPEVGTRLAQTQLMIGHEERLLEELHSGAVAEWTKVLASRPQLKELNVVEMPGLVKGYLDLQASLAPQQIIVPVSNATTTSPLPVESSQVTASPPAEIASKLQPAKVDIAQVKVDVTQAKVDSAQLNVNAGTSRSTTLTADQAFRLYDTFGVDVKTISRLAEIEKLTFDPADLKARLDEVKRMSKEGGSVDNAAASRLVAALRERKVAVTDDSLKYEYRKELHYMFPEVECKVLALMQGEGLVDRVVGGGKKVECGVVLDYSMLYHEAGGQQCDKGWLRLDSGADFKIEEAINLDGYKIHYGYIEDGNLHVGDVATLELDFEHRLGNMRNHTATHLINGALRQILMLTSQRSSKVTTDGLSFDFSVYDERFTVAELERIETAVNDCIKAKAEVSRRTVTANEMLAMDHVTLMPGESYPERDIHLIEIIADKLMTSREPCCGTHVLNTADLEEFCILSLRSAGTNTRSIKAITGPAARTVHRAGRKMLNKITQMANKVDSFLDPDDLESNNGEALGVRLLQLKKDLADGAQVLPHVVRVKCADSVDALVQKLKDGARSSLRESLELEMQAVLKSNAEPYVVHYLCCSSQMDSIPLQKATRLCPDVPVLLLARSEGVLKARCCVPKNLCSNGFNAEAWMQPVLAAFNASGGPPKGQDPAQVYNMKARKVPDEEFKALVKVAVAQAKQFAAEKMNVKTEAAVAK